MDWPDQGVIEMNLPPLDLEFGPQPIVEQNEESASAQMEIVPNMIKDREKQKKNNGKKKKKNGDKKKKKKKKNKKKKDRKKKSKKKKKSNSILGQKRIGYIAKKHTDNIKVRRVSKDQLAIAAENMNTELIIEEEEEEEPQSSKKKKSKKKEKILTAILISKDYIKLKNKNKEDDQYEQRKDSLRFIQILEPNKLTKLMITEQLAHVFNHQFDERLAVLQITNTKEIKQKNKKFTLLTRYTKVKKMNPKCFPIFPSSMFDERSNIRKLNIVEYAKAPAQQLQNHKVQFIYFLYFCDFAKYKMYFLYFCDFAKYKLYFLYFCAFAKLIKKFSFMDISVIIRK